MIPSVYAVAFVLALQVPPPGPVPPATSLDPELEPTVTKWPPTITVPVIVSGTSSAATTIQATSTSPGWKDIVVVPLLDPGKHSVALPLPATLEPGIYTVTLTINPPETQKESNPKNNST